MAYSFAQLRNMHPCFSKGEASTGRIHLPVSGECNISCRFCCRSFDHVSERPGVAARLITPEESIEILEKALAVCPDIKVVGIAGPGDTLANDNALDTFRLIGKKYPHLIKCLSTNGLLLDERADDIINVGTDTLTVTVNAVDPETEAKINRGIFYHGKTYTGVESAQILIEHQLSGIRKVSAAGITVKVNTVLIPGINDRHIEEIAKAVSSAGAVIYNIIPLIPQADFADMRAPECAEIDNARRSAGKYIEVFRHCKHCRADAVGVPGKSEYQSLVYFDRIAVKETFSHG